MTNTGETEKGEKISSVKKTKLQQKVNDSEEITRMNFIRKGSRLRLRKEQTQSSENQDGIKES